MKLKKRLTITLLILFPIFVSAGPCVQIYNACADINGATDEGCIAAWSECKRILG